MALIVPPLFVVLGALGLPNPVWQLLVGQIVPTGFMTAISVLSAHGHVGHALAALYRPLAGPELWLGVAFALACLIGATIYRRRFTTLV